MNKYQALGKLFIELKLINFTAFIKLKTKTMIKLKNTTLFIILMVVITGFAACKKDKDTTAPVITLEGYNPYTVCAGTPYFDPGATATDDKDGDLTDKINTDIQVDTSQPGTGFVYYDVTDAAGNKATAIREVIVIWCH